MCEIDSLVMIDKKKKKANYLIFFKTTLILQSLTDKV